MNREEIKMLAALRALECEKTYVESELTRMLFQTNDPDSRNYQKISPGFERMQGHLFVLKRKFEEI